MKGTKISIRDLFNQKGGAMKSSIGIELDALTVDNLIILSFRSYHPLH